MSDKLTERDRWFIKHAFTAGYNTIYREIENVLHEPSPDDWLENRLRSINKTVEESLLEDAPKPAPWQPIENAPRDGTEILGWRKDAGVFVVRWTCMDEFMTDSEIEESGLDEATTAAEDWFCADFLEGARLEGSDAPTHWMPLPEGPKE